MKEEEEGELKEWFAKGAVFLVSFDTEEGEEWLLENGEVEEEKEEEEEEEEEEEHHIPSQRWVPGAVGGDKAQETVIVGLDLLVYFIEEPLNLLCSEIFLHQNMVAQVLAQLLE